MAKIITLKVKVRVLNPLFEANFSNPFKNVKIRNMIPGSQEIAEIVTIFAFAL